MAKIEFSKIRRLIESENMEDIMLGLSLLNARYEGNYETIKRITTRYLQYSVRYEGTIDIYIGVVNFWSSGDILQCLDNRRGDMDPYEDGEEIRL